MSQSDDVEKVARRVGCLEVIGHLRPFGEPPSADVCSRFYDSAGNTLDYVYELVGDTLTIWAGAKGSPAYYIGTFSADGQSVTAAVSRDGGSTALRTPSQCARSAHQLALDQERLGQPERL